MSHISHIVVASVTASVLSRIFIGELPTLESTPFALGHYGELGIYLILGLSGGLVAILFIRLIDITERLFLRLKIPEWLKPGLGGLLLGALAFQAPGALGVGYESVNTALTGSPALQWAILILFAKMAATALCIGSGMSGGIFAPSLVLGSALGASLGLSANLILPGLNLHPAHFALAGMGAVVAGA
ncbi:MAG: chloride channel protein, partial [Desulfococcaceae bacterium]